ncbi:MAG: FkbM family methyltransferase [Bacteroidetes bacterium]|nr:FkbM family methyltransferase [Bacteroidota bacterium]
MPLPTRLPFGAWWLAWNDHLGDIIFINHDYEKSERLFVERFLREGMIVLDIGAHHGFYTLLASRKVGSSGRVIAFEPSPRERNRLRWNLRLNRCHNVKVEPFALGKQTGKRDLFLVMGKDTGCNSLVRPNVSDPTLSMSIYTTTLDDYIEQNKIKYLDFIKMDAEGAEFEVLQGSIQLLSHPPRPIWLVEMQDIRTQPWGYKAVDIYNFLLSKDYLWFSIDYEGGLVAFSKSDDEKWEYNLVSVPKERILELKNIIKDERE